MSVVHSLFLFGASAIAIPILLHLFSRRPARRIEFAAIELLKSAVEARARRSRWREILLFILRVAFVLAIVLAFARPILKDDREISVTLKRGSATVILLDNTLSTQSKVSDEVLFTKAKRIVENVISAMGPEDQIAILPLVPKAGSEMGLTSDRTRAQDELSKLEPTYESGQVLPAIQKILGWLKQSGRTADIWVITDGTALAFRDGAFVESPEEKINVHVLNVRDEREIFDARLRGLKVSRIKTHRLQVEAQLLSSNPPEGVLAFPAVFEVFEKGEWKEKGRKEAAPAQNASIQFETEEPTEFRPARVRLEVNDALEIGNRSHVFLEGPAACRVAVVNGRPDPEVRDDAAYFILTALQSRFPRDTCEVTEWSLGDVSRAEEFDGVIFMADAALLSPDHERVLKSFVERGGGLIVSPGGTFTDETIARLSKDLYPAVPTGIHFPKPQTLLHLAEPMHDSMRDFAATWSASLGTSDVHRALTLRIGPSQEILLFDTDGYPALVRSSLGKGRILQFSTSLGRSWSDLPLSGAFPAFVEKLYRLGVPQKTQGGPTVLDVPVAGIWRPSMFQWKPDETLTVRSLDGGDTTYVKGDSAQAPSQPGVYEVSAENVKTKKYLHVTVDEDEFALEALDRKVLEERFPMFHFQWEREFQAAEIDRQANTAPPTKETSLFSFLAVAILFLESLLAGRLPAFRLRAAPSVLIFLSLLGIQEAFALGEKSAVRLAQIQYDGGNWQPYPNPLQMLFHKAATMTNLELAPAVDVVTLKDTKLFDHPFLYWAGDRSFPLPSSSELLRLRQFISLGGFVCFDDASGRAGSEFDTAVRALLKALFPDQELARLPKDHSIFRSFYLLESGAGRAGTFVDVWGLNVGNRTAVIYFPGDLGGALSESSAGEATIEIRGGTAQRRDALRFSVNVIYYALTLDYKLDQIHLPFILERRRR